MRDVDAPVDPRATWDLPAPGAMARTAELEPLVTRVLAPNPSPMTLDGTNTYLVGAPGSGQAVLVDPGPDDAAHLAAVEAALAARGARCAGVLVTHHHGDHAEAALPWGCRFGAQVAAATTAVAGEAGRVLAPGDRLRLAGTTLDVVATPGHTPGHQSVLVSTGRERVLITGDLLVHALQLLHPDVAYAHEVDPARARETRVRLLSGLSGGGVLATPHLSRAFVSI